MIKLTFNGTTIRKPGAYSSKPISKMQALALSLAMSAKSYEIPSGRGLIDIIHLLDRLGVSI